MRNIYSLGRLIAVLLVSVLTCVPFCRAQSATTSPGVTLYGSQIYAESGVKWGIYSFPAQAGTVPQPVWLDGDLMATGGAVYANGKYYIISFLDLGFLQYGLLLTCDIDEQTYEPLDIYEWDNSYITTDMTFDPATGNIYGCSMNADGTATFNLSTMDVTSGRQTPIAPVKQLCALAATADGTLYGIGQDDGILYTIDKTTAELTEVGPTGVQPSPNQQSATIDPATGTFYWAAYTAEGSALYTVDTSTGVATLVSEIPDKAEFVGLFVKEGATATVAPQAPADLKPSFSKADLQGRVTFTMPTLDVDGQPLTGDLDWRLSCNGARTAEGTAQPGEAVSVRVSVPQSGSYSFDVTASIGGLSSTAAHADRYVGMDTPLPVTNLRTTVSDEHEVTTRWALDSVGMHGGYVDRSATTYRIVRQPGDEVVATACADSSFVENIEADQLTAYCYEVVPEVNSLSGEPQTSGYFAVGRSKLVPYDELFPDTASFTLFTVIDANADKASWEYDRNAARVKYIWAYAASNDDWLISPPVAVEPEGDYEVTAVLQSEGDIYAGTVTLYAGEQPSVEAMTSEILEPTDIDSPTGVSLRSKPYHVTAGSGLCYFGLHVTGKRSIWDLYLNSFRVERVMPSGLTSLAGGQPVKIGVRGHVLHITNEAGAEVTVYGTDGRLIHRSASSSVSLTLPRGTYVVAAGGAKAKVVI